MKTQCPNCKQHYEVDDEFLGATVSCEICKKDFVIEELVEKEIKKPIMTALNACKRCGKMIPAGDKLCIDCLMKSKKKKEILYPLLGMIVPVLLVIFIAILASIPSKEQKEKRMEQQIRQKVYDSLAYLNNDPSVSNYSLAFYSGCEIYITLKDQNLPDNYADICDSAAKTVSTLFMDNKREKTSCTAYLQQPERKNVLYRSTAKDGQITSRDFNGFHALSPEKQKQYRKEQFLKKYVNPDGSVQPVVEYAKSKMKNPDSFQHVETICTSTSDTNERFKVTMTFRGTNSFGGVVPSTITVDVSWSGYIKYF